MIKPLKIFALALLLFGCTGKSGIYDHLSDIDSYIVDRPDSALAALEAIDIEQLGRGSERAYYALLFSEAKDRNRIFETSDSLIRDAVEYYVARDDEVQKLMRSWYYLGLTQVNAKDEISALVSFREAERLSVQSGDDFYRGLILRNIAQIYANSFDSYHAIDLAEESAACFQRAGKPLYADYSRLMLGRLCYSEFQFEKSDSLFEALLQDVGDNKSLRNEIRISQFRSYIRQNPPQVEKAQRVIDTLMKGGDYRFSHHDVASIAVMYELSGSPDYADAVIEEARKNSTSNSDSVVVDQEYYRILEHRGEYKEALKALEQALELQNEIVLQKLRGSISYSEGLYFRAESEKQKTQLAVHRLKSSIIILSCLILLLFAVIIIVAVIHNKNKRIRTKVAEAISAINALKQAEADNAILSTEVCSLLSSRLQILEMLFDHYKGMTVEKRGLDRYESIYAKEEAVKSFVSGIEAFHNDKRLTEGLVDAVNTAYDGIVDRFRSLEPKAGEKDVKLFSMIVSGIPDETAAFFLDISVNNLRVKKHRFKQTLLSSGNPEGRLIVEKMQKAKMA